MVKVWDVENGKLIKVSFDAVKTDYLFSIKNFKFLGWELRLTPLL